MAAFYGVDNDRPVTVKEAAEIKRLSYDFVMRYINRKCQPGFSMTDREPAMLSGAGLSVVSIYTARIFTNCPGELNHQTGVEDGAAAVLDARHYGQPEHTMILLDMESWDAAKNVGYKAYCTAFCNQTGNSNFPACLYVNEDTMKAVDHAFGGLHNSPFDGFFLSLPDQGSAKNPVTGPVHTMNPPEGFYGLQYSFYAKVLSDNSFDADVMDGHGFARLAWRLPAQKKTGNSGH